MHMTARLKPMGTGRDEIPFLDTFMTASGILTWFAAALLMAGSALGEAPIEDALPVGQAVPKLTLVDIHGQARELAPNAAGPRVVVFLGVDCPLAQAYAPRLAQLHARFERRGVQFLAIDPCRQDSLEEMARFIREYSLPFPFWKDPRGAATRAFGATRTPEAFVVEARGHIVYAGRIDDQYGLRRGRKYARTAPPRDDLVLAVEDVLAGRPVAVARTESSGCRISLPRTPDPSAKVTWAGQIASIFQRSCQSCHRPGQIAPFSLVTYEDTVGWEDMIAEVVEQRRMPPWSADPTVGEFANDCRLPEADRDAIREWVRSGAPPGDLDIAPKPLVFRASWRSIAPDLVVSMAEPFLVPAEGVLEYQHFVIDPGLREGKWVRAMECRPGNPAVVHHMSVYAVPPGESVDPASRRLLRYLLVGTNPGTPPLVLPKGSARWLPAGTRFVFQMHYTPRGLATSDQSTLGLEFAKPAEVTRPIDMRLLLNLDIRIPPGASAYRSTASHRVEEDVLLFLLNPHMHLRGKAMRVRATYPDGRRETLLNVPRYDFRWQDYFLLKEPKLLPAGTELTAEAIYDNSADNPSNPDPTATVRWGDQSWDEMMVCVVGLMPVREDPAWSYAGGHEQEKSPWPEGSGLAIVTVAGICGLGLVAWLIRAWSRRPARGAPASANLPTDY